MIAHLTVHEFPLLAVVVSLALGIGIGVGATLAFRRLAARDRR
jgi:hypothetical protein